jgi:uncharacterized damage-inducible protein DinB
MSVGVDLNELMEYTEWQRSKWYETLRQRGDSVLAISAGEHGDGRFQSMGDLVKHIFSAEKRYVERLSNRPLTDPASIPNDSIAGLFEFGGRSRKDLKEFVEAYPAGDWDMPQDFHVANNFLRATPRKIIVHVLMHEIRHWAQIGTMLRLNGVSGGFHDFLFSPALGGEFRSQSA